MKQVELETASAATLAKSIAVLTGELMECFQWDDVKVDGDACENIVGEMMSVLAELKRRFPSRG